MLKLIILSSRVRKQIISTTQRFGQFLFTQNYKKQRKLNPLKKKKQPKKLHVNARFAPPQPKAPNAFSFNASFNQVI
jgi:hypothetical protein